MKKKLILSITLVVLLIGGALLANNLVGRVSASTGTTTDNFILTNGGPGWSDEDLANALGISLEELTAAQEKAFTTAVNAALKAELITSAQAETLKAGNDSFSTLYRYLSESERTGFEQDVYLAKALGISETELQAAYTAMEQARIDQMVSDGVLTQEEADLQSAWQALRGSTTFEANMKQAMTDAINAEVKAGTLTQAQADLLIANLDKMPMGFGMGMPGMRGMEGFGDMEGMPGMRGMEGFGGRGGHRGPGGR